MYTMFSLVWASVMDNSFLGKRPDF